MKKIFFVVALIVTALGQNSLAQNNASKTQPSELLTQYYAVKDALISGNSGNASAKAAEFVATANAMDASSLPEASRAALVKDASDISKSKDLKKQREYFADFSDHMFALAKAIKLSDAPIYKAYCPMKKASWLSSTTAIKNPYFGSAMLTCGKVVETLK
ncbi:hypothetical protein BCY91_06290 [Pelobium manganitolerans]|uniref:DUF3347 domain-containing protein n=1 Tax=Pelobium manganitolerans TaxID=1842495 RepID=A0A419S4X9_9SPHI|nr:DUF3347 domain-containing protein [Pelobium manganitolerans]RKD15127.1 hypothetical protein BCY91_06290 [Pelobium manganitolerans]